jgi:hypothetical protein
VLLRKGGLLPFLLFPVLLKGLLVFWEVDLEDVVEDAALARDI